MGRNLAGVVRRPLRVLEHRPLFGGSRVNLVSLVSPVSSSS